MGNKNLLKTILEGIRMIPMFDDVKRALLDERLKQMEHGFTQSVPQVVDGEMR